MDFAWIFFFQLILYQRLVLQTFESHQFYVYLNDTCVLLQNHSSFNSRSLLILILFFFLLLDLVFSFTILLHIGFVNFVSLHPIMMVNCTMIQSLIHAHYLFTKCTDYINHHPTGKDHSDRSFKLFVFWYYLLNISNFFGFL